LAPENQSPGLSYDIIYVILGLAVIVELQLVTVRQTDRWTDTRLQHVLKHEWITLKQIYDFSGLQN